MNISELDGHEVVRGLIRISEILNASNSLRPRMEKLCEETTRVLQCDRSSIMLWDGGKFRAQYNYGNPVEFADAFRKYSVAPDRPLVSEIMKTHTYVVVNDVATHPGLEKVASVAGIVSMVVAPMFSPDKSPLGFMTAEYNERLGHFDEIRGELVLGAARLAQGTIITHRERRERIRSLESRRRLLKELVSAEDKERRRISREIHDDSLQRMLALRLQLSALGDTELPPQTIAVLANLESDCQQACDSLRWILQDLHPPSLESSNLTEALESLLSRTSSRQPWQFRIDDNLAVQPEPAIETILYRIAQQAIGNIELHAQATMVTLSLATVADGTGLTITDDGSGFNPSGVGDDRFGLVSMRERATHAGGHCSVESSEGTGTTVTAWIPHSI